MTQRNWKGLEHLRAALEGRETYRVPSTVRVETGLSAERILELRGQSAAEIVRATKAEPLIAPNGQQSHVKIIASSSTLARDNGIIPVEAWKEHVEKYFPNNPVVLYGHNPDEPPIATTVDLRIVRGANPRLVEWWNFNDVSPLSQQVHALYLIGDMRAASVGFIIHDWHRLADPKELALWQKKYPRANEYTWVCDEAELVETSAVPVPADPMALVEQARQVTLRAAVSRAFAPNGDAAAPPVDVDELLAVADDSVREFVESVQTLEAGGTPVPELRARYLALLHRDAAAPAAAAADAGTTDEEEVTIAEDGTVTPKAAAPAAEDVALEVVDELVDVDVDELAALLTEAAQV